MVWAPNSIWYLPASGFSPPSMSDPYGGASVVANGDVQFVISSGKSGGSAQAGARSGRPRPITRSPGVLFSAYTQQALVWTKGHVYAYSYKTRTPTDPFVTEAPPGLSNPLGPYLGSGTGGISTASPPFIIVGANQGAVNTVEGPYSSDPQESIRLSFGAMPTAADPPICSS